ncbi:MAG: spore coat protein [Bacillaceae bacterium]|nr:spore coat protein [Bacillaceae bacterium]
MPFGAHEAMEAHEFMQEKLNMMHHFNIYRQQCRDQNLRQMIDRHLDSTVRAYNEMVGYTHDYRSPVTTTMGTPSPQPVNQTEPGQIQYGLRQPQPQQPTLNNTVFQDSQIAAAMLSFHKNSARNSVTQALECADPNVRQMMLNSAVNCVNEAYEVFQYMNQKGLYQVPTMDSHTAKTFLHHYQPAPLQNQMNIRTENIMGYQTQTQ